MDSEELNINEYRVLGEIRYQIRKYLRFSEEAARSVGLEAQQHQALLAIKAINDPLGPTVTAISEFLLIRHHSAVGLIDRLVERGLVTRTRGTEDKRQVRVRLTEPGELVLRKLTPQHQEELRSTAGVLVDALTRLLQEPQAEVASQVSPPSEASGDGH